MAIVSFMWELQITNNNYQFKVAIVAYILQLSV